MAIVDRFRRAAAVGRRAAALVGQRDTTVTLVVVRHQAPVGRSDSGGVTTTTTVLDPAPKVTRVSEVDSAFGGGIVAAAGGELTAAEYEVGPITKRYAGGGYDRADLFPAGGSDTRVYYLLTGDQFASGGEKFAPVRVVRDTPQSITLVVRRTQQ